MSELLAPIPDRPEPPAEVFVVVHPGKYVGGAYTNVTNAEVACRNSDATPVRYVLAPEGSAVIPPELVVEWVNTYVLSEIAGKQTPGQQVDAILRAARGGAS